MATMRFLLIHRLCKYSNKDEERDKTEREGREREGERAEGGRGAASREGKGKFFCSTRTSRTRTSSVLVLMRPGTASTSRTSLVVRST